MNSSPGAQAMPFATKLRPKEVGPRSAISSGEALTRRAADSLVRWIKASVSEKSRNSSEHLWISALIASATGPGNTVTAACAIKIRDLVMGKSRWRSSVSDSNEVSKSIGTKVYREWTRINANNV